MNINYRIFGYIQRYNEKDYIEYLQKSKFGIWVGAHESQGFALQEALSCNVPLLVWNIKSMNQEYGSNYNDIPATSIPYWDERCGDVFYNENEMEDTFKRFNSRLYNYKPREFILENLSMEVCEIKFIETIENIM
jgi:glycosyltransferase involved in cell wall biosynthesis